MVQKIESTVDEYLNKLEEAEGSFDFQVLLEDFKEKAMGDETAVWFLFKNIIKESIEQPEVFETKPSYIVGVFYILSDLDNEKSYSLIKWFVQNCSEKTPHGVIELLSSLITSFTILEFKEFITFARASNQAQSAIGFMTLYNLFLEDRLTKDQATVLYNHSKTYTNTRYHIGEAPGLIQEHYKDIYVNSGKTKKIDLDFI
ncbi:MAG: hypothetical protein KDK36_13295 [Leptospiraceae bacterium]|nr:hypothetical protein [Leptospiraceae bacterium]